MTYNPGDQQGPQPSGGYPQPGSYPQQGGYPQPGGYPQQGGYPQPGGYPQHAGYPQPNYGGYPQQQGNGIATAGMVCGIIGVVLFWLPVIGWILAILAIIFGGVGISKANKGAPNKGGAIAGVVLGVVSIVGYVVLVIAVYNSLHP